jgi:hypothetical protein
MKVIPVTYLMKVIPETYREENLSLIEIDRNASCALNEISTLLFQVKRL